ncbi:SMC family ATPase, partial [Candidatus Babeliales bacterium]|nr:SMC family ATPase [Candidatus Babeliales bacterium]
MIPLTLQIKNFLSYGSPTQVIDFTPYKLICLSGKNGHGKSALLDALTWAIWGQARKIGSNAKADHGVLRLGQVEMMVCIDFMFNNQTYRIKRDYSKKYGNPHLHIEFGLLDAVDGHFISLTDKTVRQTQLKIEKILGLDYETFINSSFLRQGQANEFSKKSSKERKEVLSTILGLHHYDATKKYILEQSKNVTQEKTHQERLKERIAEQLESLKNIPEQKKENEKKAIELKDKETILFQTISSLEKEQEILAKKTQEHSLLLFKTTEKKDFLHTQKEHLYTITAAWKATHKALLLLPNKEHLEKQKKELQIIITAQQEQFQKSLTLKEVYLSKKELLNALKNNLEKNYTTSVQEKKVTQERLKIEEESALKFFNTLQTKQIALLEQHKEYEKTIAQLRTTISPNALVADFKEFQDMFENKKALYQKWVEQGNWINNERKSLAQKQLLSQDSQQPSCPLCEQNLSQSRKKFLHKKFYDQELFLVHRFNRLKKNIELLKITLTMYHKELGTLSEIQSFIKVCEQIQQEQKNNHEESELLKKNIDTYQRETKKITQELLELETAAHQKTVHNSDYITLTHE